MIFRAARKLVLVAFVYGALAYGGPIAVLHIVHNRLASLGERGVVALDLAVLYGLWCLAVALPVGLVAALVGRLMARRRNAWSPFPDLDRVPRRAVFCGLLVFHLVFWLGFFLYGLTYDQGPRGPIETRVGMLLWIGTIVVATGIGCLLLSLVVQWIVVRWARGRRGLWATAAGIVALAAAALFWPVAPAATEPAPSAPAQPLPTVTDTGLKVAFLGIDGATWRVIDPLLARGEAPGFARLVREGASGEIETFHDSNSAVIWASIYTGKRPSEHGVLDFYRIFLPGMRVGLFPVHRTYFKELVDRLEPLGLARRETVDRGSLSALPLWEILDHLGVGLGVVSGYYYSVPALAPTVQPGYFVSYGIDDFDRQLASGAGGPGRAADVPLFIQPPELFSEVRDLLGRGDLYWQSATLERLLGRVGQPSFVNLYTHQPDLVQHLFWKWYQPQLFLGVSAAGLAANAGRVPTVYRDIDGLIESLLARLDPHTVLVVASDHGQAPTLLHGRYFTQHRHGPPGVVFLHGGPVRHGLKLTGASVLDLFPTILYLLGAPVPQDAAGRVLTGALDEGFVRLHPIRTVPSYEGRWKRDVAGGRAGSGLDREELERLRSLGYI